MARGSTFNGRYSPCVGPGPCVITVTGDTTVWTTFVQAPYARDFAEGAATDFVEPHFAIANPSDEFTNVSLRYLPDNGAAATVEQVSLPPRPQHSRNRCHSRRRPRSWRRSRPAAR